MMPETFDWWQQQYMRSIAHLRKSGSTKSREAATHFDHAVDTILEYRAERAPLIALLREARQVSELGNNLMPADLYDRIDAEIGKG